MFLAEWNKIRRIIICLKSKTNFMVDFLSRSVATMVGTFVSILFVEEIAGSFVVMSS
jgi:hypothetical protein